MSAVGWSAVTRLVGQLANWAMTLAVIRLLRPEDYGLMAATTAIVGILQSVSYVGLADAVVQSRRVDDNALRSVFGLIVLINGAGIVILCLIAYPAAWFYDEPALVPLLQASSLTFIAIALQSIPRAQLEKVLNLRTVSGIDLIANVAGGAAVLALAWFGFGVWSLLLGMLFNIFLRAACFCWASPFFKRPRFAFGEVTAILRFGGLRTADQFLWYLYNSADIFIMGKLAGAEILGIYSVSRYIAALPVDKLALVIKPVAFPAFAQMQHERTQALAYLRKAMRLLGFLSFPIFFGISATAPQVVAIALGPNWMQATTPLAILALGMALRPVGIIIPSYLMGIGEVGASFRNTLFATILFPAAFLIGGHWGILGMCCAWLVAFPIQFFSLVRRAAIVSGGSIIGLVTPLLSPLAGSLVMYVVVRAIAVLLPPTLGTVASLVWLASAGVAVYAIYTLLFLRPLVGELRDLVRR